MSLFAAIAVTGRSQELEFGVKGGRNYNLAEMGIGPAISAGGEVFNGDRSHDGWHLGFAMRDEFTDRFYIQFDALYSQFNTTFSGSNNAGESIEKEWIYRSAQFNLSPGIKVFRFLRFQAGLNGNLALNEVYSETFGVFDLGYQVGVGVDLGPLTFDVGYNTSFNDHDGNWNGIPLSHHRSELMVSVGLLF